VLEQLGGKVTAGAREIAYRVRKNRKAHFTLTSTPSAALRDRGAPERVNEDVLRI
jgi:ribosomal protein S6